MRAGLDRVVSVVRRSSLVRVIFKVISRPVGEMGGDGGGGENMVDDFRARWPRAGFLVDVLDILPPLSWLFFLSSSSTV